MTIVHQTLSKNGDLFFQRVGEALDLIQSRDPRASEMVREEIRYIVNECLLSGSDYTRWSRACKINFDEFYLNDDPGESEEATREWYVASLASTIVYEATHGHLDSLGISYTERTRSRIERICARRTHLFLARLESDKYDLMALAPEYDVDLKRYWNYARRRQRQNEIWKRLLPELRLYWTKQ